MAVLKSWKVHLALFLGLVFAFIGTRMNKYQWDFNAYYAAAQALAQGLDPYATLLVNVLPDAHNKVMAGSYTYPPITFPFLHLLAKLSYSAGSYLWLFAHLLGVYLLIRIWKSLIVEFTNLPFFLPVLVFGFNGTFFWDIASGNITVFEQVIFWWGYSQYRKGKNWLFGFAILFSSIPKLTPLFFLSFFLLEQTKKSLLIASTILACAVGMIYFQATYQSNHWNVFIQEASARMAEGGTLSPSLLSVLMAWAPTDWPIHWSFPPYVMLAGLISTISALTLIKHRGSSIERLLLLTLVYTLILPRIKSYQFITVLPAAFYVLSHYWKKNLGSATSWGVSFLLILVLFPFADSAFPSPLQRFVSWFLTYIPYFTALGIWLALLKLVSEGPNPRVQNS